MKTIINHIASLSLIGVVFLALTSSCELKSCSSPNGGLQSKSFVLGYLDQVDSIKLLENWEYYDYSMFYSIKSEALRTGDINETTVYSSSNPPIFPVFFGYKGLPEYHSKAHYANHIEFPYNNYPIIADSLGDTNFRKMVSPRTYMYAERSGRVVILDQIESISITCDKPYLSKAAGEDIAEYFLMAYTDPVSMAQWESFDPRNSEYSYYRFVEYASSPCEFGSLDPFPYSKKHEAYKTKRQAPYDLYWGEFIPKEIQKPLKSMDFSKVPYMSCMITLRPILFPNVPDHYLFTFTVKFTNGKILESTMPYSIFMAVS